MWLRNLIHPEDWRLEIGGWGLVAGDWWLEAQGPELGWLVAWGWASDSDWSLAVQSVDWLVVQ